MEQKGITRNDLRNNGILSPGSIAKLGKNERVSIDVIEALCEYLNCQPGDIMEYVSDKKIEMLKEQLETLQSLVNQLKDKSQLSDEDITKSSQEVMKAIGENKIGEYFNSILHSESEV